MSTQKPTLLPYNWANIVDTLDPTSPEYGEIIETPPTSKIESGWVWGEKPSHKYWNWGWKSLDDYVHHVNSFGIPAWDEFTEYEIGSVVLYNPFIYQALAANTGDEPLNSSNWELIGQTLSELDDTDITVPPGADKELLVYNSASSKWETQELYDIVFGDGGLEQGISVEQLYDTNIVNPQTDDLLTFNEETSKWENKTPKEVVQLDKAAFFTFIKDIQYDHANPDDVLVYDGNIWKMKENINNGTEWKRIINRPNEYQPPFSTEFYLGGAKVYQSGTTMYIYTKPTAVPGAPESLETISDPQNIKLMWQPTQDGELAYYYNVYRDEQEYQRGVVDNLFTDYSVLPDREYFYYVTGVNQHGESTQSNKVLGHTFSEPSAPRNLDYKLYIRDVVLNWELPYTISGDVLYEVYRDGLKVGESNTLSYTDTNVSVGSHSYFIVAKNKYYSSNNSNVVNVVIQ